MKGIRMREGRLRVAVKEGHWYFDLNADAVSQDSLCLSALLSQTLLREADTANVPMIVCSFRIIFVSRIQLLSILMVCGVSFPGRLPQ